MPEQLDHRLMYKILSAGNFNNLYFPGLKKDNDLISLAFLVGKVDY